ncbi:pyridoxamine 5'-phosphate oxidase-domain-containing protein [Aspergillus taichungensis]|uniref:Pyridoxamine 5'-phosphate oxidase-domain-containing protein n=1 Tax=Aspergillus taichungensis TaxID=482145 RepID=A0A2J5HW65_9EURO|nr:pyridoxamine 5'-phosphate oxidase-domain-containing protein [Aspergillus taichungensis]
MARALTVLLSILAAANPLLCPVGATPVDTTNTAGQVILGDIDPPNFIDDTIHPLPYPHPDLDPDPETQTTSPPTWFESALLARRLLALSKTGSIASTFPPTHPLANHPITLPEYIADCEPTTSPGNPTLLALPISTTVRNAASGSNISLSLDWWAHVGSAPPVFPGFPPSEAGLPRVTLVGYLEKVDFGEEGTDEEDRVRECFLEKHPDARAWLPGRRGAPHESYWARLVVEGVYWVGGFGGLQQIGWVDLGVWRGVRREGGEGGIGGDGRGWGDVRLPGE